MKERVLAGRGRAAAPGVLPRVHRMGAAARTLADREAMLTRLIDSAGIPISTQDVADPVSALGALEEAWEVGR